MTEKAIDSPTIGDIVCDCRYKHLRVVGIELGDMDMLILEDGWRCSWLHCCDTVPHDWQHPEGR